MLEHAPRTETFTGSANNKLVGDFYGKGSRPVLLLHGGGQTRHAFAGTAQELAKAGWTALVLDQRGHGDSEWVSDGNYTAPNFAKDAIAVAAELTRRFGRPPVLVGASLGGMAGMLAEGMAYSEKREPNFAALVLVDVTPRFDPQGASKIRDFMRGKSLEGFASIEEAADAVAQYLPHRPRPSSTEGLRKNLRQRGGRWYWHWDPRFFDGPHPISEARHLYEEERWRRCVPCASRRCSFAGAPRSLSRKSTRRSFSRSRRTRSSWTSPAPGTWSPATGTTCSRRRSWIFWRGSIPKIPSP